MPTGRHAGPELEDGGAQSPAASGRLDGTDGLELDQEPAHGAARRAAGALQLADACAAEVAQGGEHSEGAVQHRPRGAKVVASPILDERRHRHRKPLRGRWLCVQIAVEPTLEKGFDKAVTRSARIVKRSLDASADEIADELREALKG